jgi:hypothetical protein
MPAGRTRYPLVIRPKSLWIAALLLSLTAAACSAGEGFGMFKTVVAIDRMAPPQRVLPIKQYALVLKDKTGRAEPLRLRIEANVRKTDPKMRMTADAPYVVTISISDFLSGNTDAIQGTFSITDRAGRPIADGYVSASNAGALVKDSNEELLEDAANDVVRMIAPTYHRSAVVLPKGRMDSLIPLAERGDWNAYLAGVERLPALPGDADAYRLYALAVGHEAMARKSYEAGDIDSAVRHLREAVSRNIDAWHAKRSETLFSEQYMPLRRAFDTPGTPPQAWTAPFNMELWESVLRIHSWMSAPAAPKGTLDNRGVLTLAASRSDEELAAEIARAAQVKFSLERADMIALARAGVPWPIIDKMRDKAGLGRREFWITPDHWQ